MTPIKTQVAILPDNAETQSGGLLLPDSAQNIPRHGTVVAVGPGTYGTANARPIPMQVKVGDTVHYSKYGGTEIIVGDDEYIIIEEGQILMID